MFCTKNNLGNFIKTYRGDQSLREFASKCEISHTHLDSIEKGIDPRSGKRVRITIETLKKIAKAMNMTVNELLIKSGEVTEIDIKSEEDESINFINSTRNLEDDDILILNLLKDMDKEKKDTIINFIKTFKS